MLFLQAISLLSILPFSLAAACTKSNAIVWPFGANSDDECAKQFGNNLDQLKACYKAREQGACNAIGGSACLKKRNLKTRASLTCSGSEICFLYTDGDLLCLNPTTSEYTDSSGGHGNAKSGAYTAANGSVTTNLGGSTPTTTRSGAGSASTGGASVAAATSSGALASTTPKSGAERQGAQAGAVIGAAGLIMHLVL